VGFHETAFIGVVGEENREWIEKGPWSLRSEEERQRAKRPWGPEDPQALNRYSYCLGDPLRCVDPTGHQGPHLDAIGWRLDFTVGFIAAIDINVDVIYNLHQQQLELGPNGLKFTPGESDINFSLGAQVLTFGGGATTGPLFISNLPENDRLNEWGWNAGGTVLPEGGVDVNVFGSLSEEKYPEGNPWGVFVGFGGGEEISAYGGGGYTWNIWDLSQFY